jgi:hypothetical protein
MPWKHALYHNCGFDEGVRGAIGKQIRMVAGFAEVAERKEVFVAGA